MLLCSNYINKTSGGQGNNLSYFLYSKSALFLLQINPGYDVPPEYYLTNLTETDKEEMDRVIVGRGGSCELEYEVESDGSILRWEFISTCHDIGYGWFHRQHSTKKKPKHIQVVGLGCAR